MLFVCVYTNGRITKFDVTNNLNCINDKLIKLDRSLIISGIKYSF